MTKLHLYIDTRSSEELIVEMVSGSVHKKRHIQKKYSAQEAVMYIEQLCKEHNVSACDITSVQVETGPGSFTGLRVGVAIANAIGWALKVPVNGISDKRLLPVYSKSKFDD